MPSIEIAVTWLPEGETAYTHPTKGVQGEVGDVLIDLYWLHAYTNFWRTLRTPAPTVRTAPNTATTGDLVGKWYCRAGGGFPMVLSLSSSGRFIRTPMSGGRPTTGTWYVSSGVVTLIDGNTIVGMGWATGNSIDLGGGCTHDPNNLY